MKFFFAFVFLVLSASVRAQEADPLAVTLPSGKVVHFQTADQKAAFLAARSRPQPATQAATNPTGLPDYSQEKAALAAKLVLDGVVDELHWKARIEPGTSSFGGPQPYVTIRRYKRTLKNAPNPYSSLDVVKRYDFSSKETLPSEIVPIRGLTMKDISVGDPVIIDIYRVTVAREEMYASVKYTVNRAEAEEFAKTLTIVPK